MLKNVQINKKNAIPACSESKVAAIFARGGGGRRRPTLIDDSMVCDQ